MPTSMITEARPVQFSAPLPEAVDVVVIGAGVAGTATAYFLAEAGVKVLLCEKGRVAGEQSSRNWGWVRQQGRDWAELPIMMEANRIWRGLARDSWAASTWHTATIGGGRGPRVSAHRTTCRRPMAGRLNHPQRWQG